MTDRSTEIATTLAKLAELLSEQNDSTQAETDQTVRDFPGRALLTVEEAARHLGIGRTTAYSLVRSGDLESVQIGRLRRIPKEAVDNYTAHLTGQNPAA